MPEFALIDGDIIAYRVASAAQRSLQWEGDEKAEVSVDFEDAANAALATVDSWVRKAGCRTPIVCLSGDTNFRKFICPTYKAHRVATVRPLARTHLIETLRAECVTHTIEGIEADDVLGILATSDRYADCVVISPDKDMATIPTTIFNPYKDPAPRRISPRLADYNWLLQVLTGDTADGYKGVPRVGPKRAAAILGNAGTTFGAQWVAVVDAYRAAKLTEADAILTARVARILRRADYLKEVEEILLWHPTNPTALTLASVSAGSIPR